MLSRHPWGAQPCLGLQGGGQTGPSPLFRALVGPRPTALPHSPFLLQRGAAGTVRCGRFKAPPILVGIALLRRDKVGGGKAPPISPFWRPDRKSVV